MNVSGLLTAFDQLPAWSAFLDKLKNNQAVTSLGLLPSTRPAITAKLLASLNRPILLITGRVETAVAWQQALEVWLPTNAELLRLPEPTPLPYDHGVWSERARLGRLQVLAWLMAGQHPNIPATAQQPIIIASARAFLQKSIPKRRFLTATRVLKVGQQLDLEKSLENWVSLGYERVTVVESPGQLSHRGGILDIFSPSQPYPVRVELFGDEIDTLRYFEPATQRSLGETAVERLIIPPAREALPQVAQEFAESLRDYDTAEHLASWQDDIPKLLAGQAFPHLEYYLPLIYPRPGSLLEYLPENGLVVVDDWPELATAVTDLQNHAQQIAQEQPSLPPNYPSPLFDWEAIASEIRWAQPLILGSGEEGEEISALAEAFNPGPRYGGQVRPFLAQLKFAQHEKERTIVLSRQASRLAELWHGEAKAMRLNGGLPKGVSTILSSPALSVLDSLPDLPSSELITFVEGSVAEGFTLVRREDYAILFNLLTDAEVFGWSRPAPRRLRTARPIAPEAYFADIQAGDYVVHIEYGIGQFDGLVVRTVGGMEREYLLVRYTNGDTLYVPVHHADRLSKWIGSNDVPPGMHRIGEKTWGIAKQKAQEEASELAKDLLELYAARETISGHAFAADTEWQASVEANFLYQETEDQLRAIADVKADMERPLPMDRLICGDVGYGKTEVALRAAFKAVMDNKQVAVLVPTTILAQQHYRTFKDRLSAYPVTVDVLSRFRTASQQKRAIQKLREGGIDIIIGTHRLLSDDISFKDLGLIIVDEEQRFGVSHKERLKEWRTEVDVLTLTATPIPRTLYMSLAGVRDISIIDTAPADRLPVQTYVGEFDESRLRQAIVRELDRGGQVFLVHNRVQTINIIRQRIAQLVPQARIGVGHGQMSERELERVMTDFADGNLDILLSTTIVESGLDFPNANTLIVDRAEQFGLSQLYQLRGRVGRATRQAYAYFFHAKWQSLSAIAQARLETIAEQTHLGAGYTVAMRDMELRGAGELLGAEQSGHVSLVGMDLYTRLLAKAVKKLKAEKKGEVLPPEAPEVTMIDLPLAAYVPPDYVPDGGLRLRLYRRMAQLDTLGAIDEMTAELADRFGPVPDPVYNLLYQLRIKALAQEARVTAVVTDAGQIKIRLPDLEELDRIALQKYLGTAVRVSRKAIWMNRELGTHEWQIALVQVLERLQGYERKIPLPALN